MPLLREYLSAVLKHWYAVVVGFGLTLLDLVERLKGTWWIFSPWVRLVTATLGLATAQFLAYRDLHQAHLKELDRLNDDRNLDAENHRVEIAALQQEIETLKIKPFDKATEELVRGKLRGLDKTPLDVLKFLLQNGPTGRDVLDSQLSVTQRSLDGGISNLRERLLIIPEDRPNIGRSSTTTFWTVNEMFVEVLRDLLF